MTEIKNSRKWALRVKGTERENSRIWSTCAEEREKKRERERERD